MEKNTNFVMIANAFIRAPGISSEAKALYALLKSYTNGRQPGFDKLQELMGWKQHRLDK